MQCRDETPEVHVGVKANDPAFICPQKVEYGPDNQSEGFRMSILTVQYPLQLRQIARHNLHNRFIHKPAKLRTALIMRSSPPSGKILSLVCLSS
jgi:hypothetical protein